jgi:hypothetical protein
VDPSPAAADGPDADHADADRRARNGPAVGFAGMGWLLLAVAGPIALFLTWYGDCFSESCPVASGFDRTVYLLDLVSWVAFPVLAFAVYAGRRVAAGVLVALGLAIVGQAIGSLAGARGFHAFIIVLPSGALIALGGVLGLRVPRPDRRLRPERRRRPG